MQFCISTSHFTQVLYLMQITGFCELTGLCCAPEGYLVSVDAYMNLQVGSCAPCARLAAAHSVLQQLTCCDTCAQLASTEEYIDGQFTGNLGEVLIRY